MRDVIFDHNRAARIGLPEAVFCEGKSREAVLRLIADLADAPAPVLFTRLAPDIVAELPDAGRAAFDYHPLSRTGFAATLAARSGRVAKRKHGVHVSYFWRS